MLGSTACATATPSFVPYTGSLPPISLPPMQSVEQERLDDVPSNAASLALSFVGGGDFSLGIEGGYGFLKATGRDGVVVLDRVVDPNDDAQSFPPGDYTLVALLPRL